MRHDRQIVEYTVEYDKGGAYVLPNALVSVASGRLDIDRSANPLKLRLDRQGGPFSLEIMDRSDAPSHTFERVNGSEPAQTGHCRGEGTLRCIDASPRVLAPSTPPI